MQNDQWDAVVFNGYVNQYAAAPIRVEPGQTIRAWVLDAGPSENSSFHVIGTIFDTVYREGHYELRPDATHGGSHSVTFPIVSAFERFGPVDIVHFDAHLDWIDHVDGIKFANGSPFVASANCRSCAI